MSAPKIIDNINGNPVQVSPDYSKIFDRPNKPNYVDIGVSSTTSLPENKESREELSSLKLLTDFENSIS